eukprot:TRINITY_DN9492_c0_g1_i4.p1 TRINITY_DN9492_c0_g1~~TRINITY_DN9492_c0_g1_i4.p1  ORF type:complete len:249 (-),score=53.74 TRINITY_DN9492_c0_g1_i4:131-877(-)
MCIRDRSFHTVFPTEIGRPSFASGAIVNTAAWSEASDFSAVERLIEGFKADILLVLDSDRLFTLCKGRYPDKAVLKLPKLSAAVPFEDSNALEEDIRQRMRRYFEGSRLAPITCPRSTLVLNDLKIYQLKLISSTGTKPLEYGETGAAEGGELLIKELPPDSMSLRDLMNSVLGVLHVEVSEMTSLGTLAQKIDKVVAAPLFCLVYIDETREDRGQFKLGVKTPLIDAGPDALRKRVWIHGDIKMPLK